MSRWMVIGAVILALALAALVFAPRAQTVGAGGMPAGSPALAPEPLLSASPSSVESILITWGDSTQHLVRGPLPDTWLREWTDASGTPRRWPVSPTRARGGIRLVHETLVQFDAPALTATEAAGTITFSGAGQEESLLLTAAALNGRRHATQRKNGLARGCLVADQIATLFDRNAVGEWLERGVFPGLQTPIARINLIRNGQTLQLGRVAQSWSLRSPVVSTVETARINDVLLALETFTISRITETLPTPASEPASVIQAEILRPSIDGDAVRRAAVRYTLQSWPAQSDRVREVPARAFVEMVELDSGSVTPLWGPVEGVVSVESVAAAMPPLRDLLGKRCLDAAASDIVEFRLAEPSAVHYSKTGDRWATPTAPLVGAELENLVALLKMLCDEHADAVKLVDADAPPAGASLRISVNGAYSVDLQLRLVDSEGKAGTQVLFVRNAGIDRGYDLSQRPALRAWLAALLPV